MLPRDLNPGLRCQGKHTYCPLPDSTRMLIQCLEQSNKRPTLYNRPTTKISPPRGFVPYMYLYLPIQVISYTKSIQSLSSYASTELIKPNRMAKWSAPHHHILVWRQEACTCLVLMALQDRCWHTDFVPLCTARISRNAPCQTIPWINLPKQVLQS